MIKQCIVCGKDYQVKPCKAEKAKYCSLECNRKDKSLNKKMTICTCKTCGKEFEIQSSRVSNGRGKHCSKQCFVEDQRKNNNGENHSRWRGGKFIRHGYIFVFTKDHPYKNSLGYVREHRLVMENYLGRYLLPDEVVHHINGDTLDNRIENLQLLSKKEHNILHKLGKKHNKKTIYKLINSWTIDKRIERSRKMKEYWKKKREE